MSRVPWHCWALLAALVVMALWFGALEKGSAAWATALAAAGCLALVATPRERMPFLPLRLSRLPRRYDSAPALATLITAPGYGLSLFHGANPFDEFVHLVNGAIAGAVFAALVLADGRPRGRWHMAWVGLMFGLTLGVAWEGFEWLVNIIGDWQDTWTDVALTAGGATVASWLHGGHARNSPAGVACHESSPVAQAAHTERAGVAQG
ncbi:hypothetical protein ACI6QG_06495 [Roseococcus sp. DSY-14]|uniref:hypothetical protein n=1 Tax=Roseococcus sp. DSY-14 TaxID=3369650 RepID=UPI00387B2708